jgi:tripartite-type tricarboxylate transporter receptor subunit TctC
MKLPMLLARIGLLAAMVGTGAGAALAQSYPSKPIRLIVPFAPGGGADLVARAVAGKLSASLGQQVVVENRAGGGTIIGTDLVAKSPPDGYTLLVGSPSLVINPALRKDLPFDTLKDLAPVAKMVDQPLVVVVNTSLPVKSFPDLIRVARTDPGGVAVASPGIGSAGHLATALLNQQAGIELLHVPYKGTGPALTDLLGGQVQMMFASSVAVGDHVKAGALRALSVSTAKRSMVMSDLPTIAESGLPDYEAGGWSGILAPAGTPEPIVRQLNQHVMQALETDDLRKILLADGAEPAPGSPAEFGAFLARETDKWARVIKTANIRPE